MSRRTLITIISFCLIAIFGSWLIKWYFFSSTPISTELKNLNSYPTVINKFINLEQTGVNKLEEVISGQPTNSLTELNDYQLAVADYTLFERGTSTYWLAAEKKTGYFYLGDTLTKNKTKISNLPFLNIDHLGVLVKKEGLIIVVHNQNPNDHPSVKIIDLNLTTSSSSVSELPLNIKDFIISPNQQQIIFTEEAGEQENWLLTDATFSQFKNIYSTPYQDFTLHWPNPNLIIFYPKPSDQNHTSAYSLDLKTGLTEKIADGKALEVTTNASSSQILLSGNNGQISASLKINNNTFTIPTTASKCLLKSEVNSLCAVPHYYLTSIDDWYKGKLVNSDDLYLIDNQTGQSSKWRTLKNLDVINLQSTIGYQMVFFMDKTSGELWSALAE